MGLLKVAGVVAGYSANDQILKGLDFEVSPGEVVGVVGPNGAGKSTLLKAIAGLLAPSAGSIELDGRAVAGMAPAALARLGIAYVPQEHNVFPTMTVRENLELGGFVEPRQVTRRMREATERFPMLGRKRRLPARALSGGERQVLAMAMALMVAPVLLLLDEPTAGLSPKVAAELFAAIRGLGAGGLGVALVEQNATEALAIADRAYVLVDGRNGATGPAAALAADPEIRRMFLGG